MRHLLPLLAGAAALTQQGYQRQRVVRSATRLPQEPAELADWLKPYAGADDFRAERQQQLAETASDLEITFLGTASCVPSVTRGVSCTALRYDGATYLFDAGEATQVQAQRTTLVKPGKVEAIFVTHLHGDHTFGLPGLLCLCGQDRDASDQPIEIFGPEGLRAYVRASLQLTQSRVAAPHVIHELVGVPNRPPPGFRARAASFIVAFALGAARRRREAGRHRRDALTTTKTQARRAAPSCRRKRRASRKRPLARSSRGEIFPGTPPARGPARRGPRH